MIHSPFVRQASSVQVIMFKVLAALVPGIAVYVWVFGVGILATLAVASLTALAAEAAMLAARGRPVARFVTDGSALVTAWLIALTFPPIAPWWLIATATLFAIVILKHLYGGLGHNPFNPAMGAYCAMIVAFPALMSQWPHPGLDAATALQLVLGGERNLDAVTGATPLDALRTGLREAVNPATVPGLLSSHPAFGFLGGRGWELIALGYLAGGLFLLQQRIISWHMPFAFLATLFVTSGALHLADPKAFAGPLFHLASGGAMLAAFFIVTDPVSGATTPRGKLLFAGGIGLLTLVIRAWGAYPEGIAFATLLMNICVPLIDMKTQPPVFGHKRGESGAGKPQS